jgi:dGTPase
MEKLLTPLTDERFGALDERESEAAGEAPPQEDSSPDTSYRSPAQRDRDRILYSAAFARLAYVTQVTAPESGHSFHNRLTHSLKVAQVGRRNAERLHQQVLDGKIMGAAADMVCAVDPDSVEASCLAHDLGHPPFGHIAEDVLREEGKKELADAFEGNAQSFRLVTRLSVRTDRPGLDLTRRTLDGVLKYPWLRRDADVHCGRARVRKWGAYLNDKKAFEFARKGWPPETDEVLPERCFEAELMDWADDLTYAVHDVDDFFRAGLIPLDRLAEGSGQPEAKRLADMLKKAREADPDRFPKFTVEELVDAATRAIGRYGPSAPYQHTIAARAEMRTFGSKLITRYLGAFGISDDPDRAMVKLAIGDEERAEVEALKLLVVVYVIRRPGLAALQHGQQRIIRNLFCWYMEAAEQDRRLFPPSARERLEAQPHNAAEHARIVIDLISGLTESAAITLHERLSGGVGGIALDATAAIG